MKTTVRITNHYLAGLLVVAFEEPSNLDNISKSKRLTSLSKFLYCVV